MYESLERHLIHVSVSCAFIFKAIYYVENGLYAQKESKKSFVTF